MPEASTAMSKYQTGRSSKKRFVLLAFSKGSWNVHCLFLVPIFTLLYLHYIRLFEFQFNFCGNPSCVEFAVYSEVFLILFPATDVVYEGYLFVYFLTRFYKGLKALRWIIVMNTECYERFPNSAFNNLAGIVWANLCWCFTPCCSSYLKCEQKKKVLTIPWNFPK